MTQGMPVSGEPFAEVLDLLAEFRVQAVQGTPTHPSDQHHAIVLMKVINALERAIKARDEVENEELEVYRAAIRGVLDLPFKHAEVHNRYLHFVLDNRRIPNMMESINQINCDHFRACGHLFIQAEGLSLGQCRDCCEDAEGTRYGSGH